jgi:hypothetical protein
MQDARKRAGMTMAVAAGASGQSEQSVRRIEQGTVSSTPGKIIVMCNAYGVSDYTRDALVGLAKETKSKGWWHSYGDMIPTWFEAYVTLEQTASRIRVFEPQLVPGLLQHSSYMELVIRTDLPDLREDQVAARIELRRSRQGLLHRSIPEPPRVEVIISEAVLLAEPPVEDVMRTQMWHLLQASELPCLDLRLLPLRSGPHRGSVAGAWTLLDFPAQNGNNPPPSTVYSENLTGALYLDKQAEIDAYTDVWNGLDAAALDPAESIEVMSQRLKELNDRVEAQR